MAVSIVAGVVLLIGGGVWLMSDSGDEDVDISPLPTLEQAAVPAYEEYSENERYIEPEIDDMAGDITRIVIQNEMTTDDVDINKVLTGKVIIDGQVVQQAASQ